MKRFVLLFTCALFVAFLFTDCKGPKRVGKKMGKIICEQYELQKEMTELNDDMGDLKLDDEDDRKEAEKIMKKQWRLEKKKLKLDLKAHKLGKASIRKFSDEDAYKDYSKEASKAVEEYVKDNCKDAMAW